MLETNIPLYLNNTMGIYYFDINGTVTLIDSTENKTRNDLYNMIVSKNIYGTIKNGKWIMNENCFDGNEEFISYYKYHRKKKDHIYKFTEPGYDGEQFRYLYDAVKNELESDNIFFESFINFIKQTPDIKLVFRTFGRDREIIVDNVIKYLEKKNFIFAKIVYDTDCNEYKLVMDNNIIITGVDNIHLYIENTDSHFYIVDCYEVWAKNGRNKLGGKPVWSNSTIPIHFFDDNNCVDIKAGDNIKIHKVNSLMALINKNYFIDLIN